jgi:photosystem II stability/assembly factor-like uncharacterized protein
VVTVPTRHLLFGVACPTPTECVAVGDAGTALATHDAGRAWVRVRTGVGVPLSSVACPTKRRCYAVGDGNTVIATGDGGIHWHRSLAGLGVLDGVACASATRCAAVTSAADQNLDTVDGSTWTAVPVPFSPLDALSPLNGIACAGQRCVAVGGHGLLALSTDGGAGWSTGQSDTTENLQAASCPSAVRCVVVGPTGTVLRSSDGGATWDTSVPPTGETLLSVSCPNASHCVAVGSGGTIVTSSDGDVHWSVRSGRPAPSPAIRVLVVGDSFAHTLAAGVARNAPAYGVALIDGSLDGCALARGPVLVGGRPYPVTGPCAASGPGWEAQYQADVATDSPALSLLVLGPWDLSTRYVAGAWQAPGQPGFDAYYTGQVIAAVRILTSGGGRVAITTAPEVLSTGPEFCVPLPATRGGCPTETQRVAALDTAARQAAAEYPGRVQMIGLGGRLAPHGTFVATVDGVVVRAADGVHLSEAGGEWLTPWLVPQLATASR